MKYIKDKIMIKSIIDTIFSLSINKTFDKLSDDERDFNIAYCNADPYGIKVS